MISCASIFQIKKTQCPKKVFGNTQSSGRRSSNSVFLALSNLPTPFPLLLPDFWSLINLLLQLVAPKISHTPIALASAQELAGGR